MSWSFSFFANSALLGVGLAMDAFSVSLANGLNEPDMGRGRGALIAGTFAFFQFLMPMIASEAPTVSAIMWNVRIMSYA